MLNKFMLQAAQKSLNVQTPHQRCVKWLLSMGFCLIGTVAGAAEDEIQSPSDYLVRPHATPAHSASHLAPASYHAAAPAPLLCCSSEKKQTELAAAIKGAYKPVFYNNNFAYINDPCYRDHLLGDRFKRLDSPLGTFDFGGEARVRYMDERGFSTPGLGLTGNDSNFWLHRTRLFANWEVNDWLRIYSEGIHADQGNIVSAAAYNGNNGHVPRGIEINRMDMLNLFADVMLLEECDRQLMVRGGRQELLYGNQRLISPLDWSNTRRTFDGGKLMYRDGDLSIDGLWARPLVRDFNDWDAPDSDIQLYGVYGSRANTRLGTLDLYWLALDNDRAGFRYDTLGTRFAGEANQWIWDMEFGYQFGDNTDNSSHNAEAVTLGLGRAIDWCLGGRELTTRLMFYYDYASGGDVAGNGWHHYFPLAHKYQGFMDLFGRRNIHDWNVQAVTPLTERLSLLLWYHHFELDRSTTPFNVNMTPFSAAPAGDDTLGDELDILLTVTLSPRTVMLFGISHFAAGDYYSTTAGVPSTDDANFFYWQAHHRF